MPDVHLREEQRFHPAVTVLVIISGLVCIAATAMPYLIGEQPGWLALVVGAVIGVGLPLLFLAMRLIVEVDSARVLIRFVPFVRREIPLRSIRSHCPCTYSPIADFGGWGIRYGRGGKMAYNARGNRGVELTLENGKIVVIGSQRPEDLDAMISRATGA